MTISLHTIKPAKGSKHRTKRIGRGLGSGHGTFSTRGTKGQRARTGGTGGLKYLGMRHIVLSTPKSRGFKSRTAAMEVLNIADLNRKMQDGAEITPEVLRKAGLAGKISNGVKILGDGETKKKFIVSGCVVSASAKEKIERAGGSIK